MALNWAITTELDTSSCSHRGLEGGMLPRTMSVYGQLELTEGLGTSTLGLSESVRASRRRQWQQPVEILTDLVGGGWGP